MMSQPTPNDEADSRFAGLAVAAAAAKERRARPQVHSPQRVEAPLPAAQEGTWLAQRKREREGLGAAPSSGATTADPAEQYPKGEGASLTVSAIIPIRLNEAVVAGNTEGSTITPLERLLRDMGVEDSDTIAASLRVQTQLGMYTGATKLTGNAVRAVVDGEGANMVSKEDAFRGGSGGKGSGGCLLFVGEEDIDEERQLLREAPLSYSLRNHTTEAGVACEQAVASWTVPAVSAITTSSFLEAYARHAPGETSSGSDHSATFKQFFHNAVVSDYAHNNVATGVFPPGVTPLGNNQNNGVLVTGDCGVVQPVFCRLPPPGAGLPIQASEFLFPGEMLSVPTQGPIFNLSTGGTRSSRGGSTAAVNDDPSTLFSIPSSWMLSGLQVGSASMPLGTVDPLCTRAFVSSLISASVETKLRAKEASYILQLLTPPPEDSIHLTPTPTSVSPNSASPNAPGAPTVTLLVHEPIIGITFRRHHWKAPSLVAAIKKKQEEVDATSNSNSVSASLNYSVNCRVNLLYVCGFLMSRSAPKGTGLSSSENTPPEEPLFALSDDSFSGCGIPPAGVVQAPSEAHSMSRSHFLSLVDKNKELAAGLLRHLFDIKHKYLESAAEPTESPAHQKEEDGDSVTAHTIFNDTDRFYGRLSLTYRSCLQALLWLPVLVASAATPTIHTATTTSPRRTLLSVDSTQLVVSEPLCYIIKVLSERDNETMYSSTTTSASLLDVTPMLGPGELASFVSASTSTLVSLCPPPSAPPTPTSMDRSPPPANSLIPTPPTLSPPQHDAEPVLMLGNEFGATATVQLLNTTPVKRVSSLETSTNTVNGSPEDGSSRLRHQCQRSAQLLALLLNNIILKRARALHLWDSQQRRSMGSLSSGSSSPQALARAAQQVPDTHPSVLSSLFFDATVVELTSFALHFRSVKECTELFQTLKRF